jgi:soluble lytic murein transglycosylase-like protein
MQLYFRHDWAAMTTPMGNGGVTIRTISLGAALAAALVVSGCSGIASLKGYMTPSNKPAQVAEAPKPVKKPFWTAKDGEVELLAFAEAPKGPAHVNSLIAKYAAHYDVPESLVHRLVKKESGYNPRARNGPYWGLMQISAATARSMGYRGESSGLLDADTNLKYAVKYLRGAWIVGGYSEAAAIRGYQRGYYYDAKRKGLLEESGLR